MEQPTASMLVIGDELLSGRTQDANMHHLANKLTEIGINLSEARFIRDDAAVIVSNIVELSTKFDYLFTSGGIGPTHDDITTDCVAEAFGRQVSVRSDAFNILKKYYDGKGIELNEARLRMARIPEKADLIENIISGAPGYIIENVYVMAGVPRIFQSMLQTVLPNLKKGTPTLSISIKLYKGEGDIALELEQIVKAFSKLTFGSYPFNENGIHGTNIVIRGKDKKLMIKAEEKVRTIA
jgi:molybdenum cofactor synthesis domain-containing protein|tara:strand:- start:509 stop:1225 length:717 start_codon:yes stop_codon:yes gene_type:complete